MSKVGKHISSGFPMSTISSFVGMKKIFTWKFCECLIKHAKRNFKKKKMKLLTKANKQQESFEKPKTCFVCGEKLEDKYGYDKKSQI